MQKLLISTIMMLKVKKLVDNNENIDEVEDIEEEEGDDDGADSGGI
jgi:hypothetical protein